MATEVKQELLSAMSSTDRRLVGTLLGHAAATGESAGMTQNTFMDDTQHVMDAGDTFTSVAAEPGSQPLVCCKWSLSFRHQYVVCFHV